MDARLRVYVEEILDLMLGDEHINLLITVWKGLKDQGWVNNVSDAVIADVVRSLRTELTNRAKVLQVYNDDIHSESYPIIERRISELQHKIRIKLNG